METTRQDIMRGKQELVHVEPPTQTPENTTKDKEEKEENMDYTLAHITKTCESTISDQAEDGENV